MDERDFYAEIREIVEDWVNDTDLDTFDILEQLTDLVENLEEC